jgi:hypothetical protein
MGGAPRIIRKVVSPVKKIVRPPSSPIAERREEVAKKTEPEAKQISPRKLKRRGTKVRGRRRAIVGGQLTGGETQTADYSPIRNPRDGSKLGSA